MELNKIYNEDCIGEKGMCLIPDKSIDMILCDLPYGTTACSWDVIIPFEKLWKEYERVIKDNGAIVLTASQPFTTDVINSNRKWFKYCWIWNKKLAGNGILAKIQPLKIHEDVCVFSKSKHYYYPIMTKRKARVKNGIEDKHGTFSNSKSEEVFNDEYYPTSIIEVSGAGMRIERIHPTQKPVELFEYLIKTYTNVGETVLDNCMGSGTTAIAAIKTNRNYIGFELNKEYFDLANNRIKETMALYEGGLFALEKENTEQISLDLE